MSDLQCAATLVLVVPGEAEAARELGLTLRDRRVALVYAGDGPGVSTTAEVLADVLAVPLRTREGLEDCGAAEPAGDVVVRMSAALSELADEHRGETVLVVGGEQAVARAVPSLARNVSATYADERPLRSGGTAEVRVDADGWVLDSWMGEAPG